MKKFFGFGSSTPPPPSPPARPPGAPAAKPTPAPAPRPGGSRPEPPKTQPAPSPTPSIVGRWKDPSSGDLTEFHADGSVTENVSGGEPIRGRYAMTGGTLKINLQGVPNELSFPVTIKGDTLEMVDPDGHMTRYQRQR